MREEKYNEDDDEIVVADMSNVQRRSSFVSQSLKDRMNVSRSRDNSQDLLTKEERKWYILGALKAAISIGLVYAVVIGLFILLIVVLYKMKSG